MLIPLPGIWIRDVRAVTGGAQNTWVGTDIEDSYFPIDKPADTSYYHQSMTEPWTENEPAMANAYSIGLYVWKARWVSIRW